jgi:hypothetical protein
MLDHGYQKAVHCSTRPLTPPSLRSFVFLSLASTLPFTCVLRVLQGPDSGGVTSPGSTGGAASGPEIASLLQNRLLQAEEQLASYCRPLISALLEPTYP